MSELRSIRVVIGRLCVLASRVGSVKFKDQLSHDCFCGTNKLSGEGWFRFDMEILDFIEEVVNRALDAEGESQLTPYDIRALKELVKRSDMQFLPDASLPESETITHPEGYKAVEP